MFGKIDRFVLIGILILLLGCLFGVFGLCKIGKAKEVRRQANYESFSPSFYPYVRPLHREPIVYEAVEDLEQNDPDHNDPIQYLVHSNILLPSQTVPLGYRRYPDLK